VDTNVARVIKRVFATDVDVKSGRGQKRVWGIARELLPRTGTATWIHNQALMELGALVCTARVAHCGACPVRSVCASYANGAFAHPSERRRSRGGAPDRPATTPHAGR
jgi:A/G-specific adenine glycosylase